MAKFLIISERKSEYMHHLVRVGCYNGAAKEYSFIQELSYYFADKKLKQHTITIGYKAAKKMVEA